MTSEELMEKLTEIHPMKQIVYAAILQAVMFFGMLGAFWINSKVF